MESKILNGILGKLHSEGGLNALLPQNLTSDILNELCEISEEFHKDPYCERSEILAAITCWFLYGRKYEMILPSLMYQKNLILARALTAEKIRRTGLFEMRPWPLPDIDNLFDEKDNSFYFYI